jgi:hypothetical protein
MGMTDLQFEILDELYFVQSFQYLEETLKIPQPLLVNELSKLFESGWIRCLKNGNEDVQAEEMDLQQNYKTYLYLATKSGLMAHNTSF